MCAAYWNLDVPDFACPTCGERGDWNFQTHYGGWSGSCSNHYAIGEPVAELEGVTGRLSDLGDDFIADCPKCGGWGNYDAMIENGAVSSLRLRPWSWEPAVPKLSWKTDTKTQ